MSYISDLEIKPLTFFWLLLGLLTLIHVLAESSQSQKNCDTRIYFARELFSTPLSHFYIFIYFILEDEAIL